EVRDGILKHSKGKGPIISDKPGLMAATLEGQIVRVADIVAYVNHDLDDAIRGGLLTEAELPAEVRRVLGEDHGARLRRLARAVADFLAGMTDRYALRAYEELRLPRRWSIY